MAAQIEHHRRNELSHQAGKLQAQTSGPQRRSDEATGRCRYSKDKPGRKPAINTTRSQPMPYTLSWWMDNS